MNSIKQLTLDTSNSEEQDLGAQIALALCILESKEANQVNWTNYEFNCSFVISSNDDMIRVSIGDTNQIVNEKAKQGVKDIFGNPNHEYTRESILNEGLYLHCMVWETNNNVC